MMERERGVDRESGRESGRGGGRGPGLRVAEGEGRGRGSERWGVGSRWGRVPGGRRGVERGKRGRGVVVCCCAERGGLTAASRPQ